jgi:hypothetical protein
MERKGEAKNYAEGTENAEFAENEVYKSKVKS